MERSCRWLSRGVEHGGCLFEVGGPAACSCHACPIATRSTATSSPSPWKHSCRRRRAEACGHGRTGRPLPHTMPSLPHLLQETNNFVNERSCVEASQGRERSRTEDSQRSLHRLHAVGLRFAAVVVRALWMDLEACDIEEEDAAGPVMELDQAHDPAVDLGDRTTSQGRRACRSGEREVR